MGSIFFPLDPRESEWGHTAAPQLRGAASSLLPPSFCLVRINLSLPRPLAALPLSCLMAWGASLRGGPFWGTSLLHGPGDTRSSQEDGTGAQLGWKDTNLCGGRTWGASLNAWGL